MGISILGFILVLVPLVVFHEMGHFLMCKAAGVRVSQFAIGFGKKLFGFRFKGTEYRWNLIPLGGYVDFMGDAIWDEKIPDDPNHFYNKSKFVRILILVMGPLFNFLLTFLIFWFIYSKPAKPPIYFDQPFTVGMVMADSNEAKAGLQVGDQILKIGDQSITDPDQMTNELLMMPDKTVSLTINRAGSQHVLDYQVPTDPKDGVGIPQLYPAVRILIRSVQEDSPAAKAGLRAGDFIRALDGEPVFFPWGSDVNPLVNKLNDGRAFPITVTIERNGVLETMSMNPTTIETDTGKRFIIGIGLDYEHRLVDRSLA
ncbi:MAG: RIP metalloprotease RseP, partial [Acidobacteria bacterium]|nr:RIP metalloprotease RseP [Acidobacteriota bacterium]